MKWLTKFPEVIAGAFWLYQHRGDLRQFKNLPSDVLPAVLDFLFTIAKCGADAKLTPKEQSVLLKKYWALVNQIKGVEGNGT